MTKIEQFNRLMKNGNTETFHESGYRHLRKRHRIKMKQHMKQQIFEGKWVEVECIDGTWAIPAVLDGGEGIGSPPCWKGDIVLNTDCRFAALALFYEIYCPGRTIISFEIKHGFGARLSASGYLDSTNWVLFDTVPEALVYLEELQNGD